MTNFTANFTGFVNNVTGLPLQQCQGDYMLAKDVLPWCKQQHYAHAYIYMPLLAIVALLLAIESTIKNMGWDNIVLFEVPMVGGGINKITAGYMRDVCRRGAMYCIDSFILIWMLQNGIWPFSYINADWLAAINSVLGFAK